jgi:dienelactone hydrolase
LAQRLDLPHVEWVEATGQAEMMDYGPPEQVLASATITRVATWVSGLAPAQAAAIRPPPSAGSAVVARTSSGASITETPAFVAPKGLFGILCEVDGPHSGPTIVLLSVANEPRSGPARLWVDLSRRWAAAGLRCFRIDLSGQGDSPVRHAEQPRFRALGVEAFDDVTDAMRFASADDPSDVVLVGLCSSAYQALESALDAPPRGVVAVQPVLSMRPHEIAAGRPMDPRRRIAMPRNSVVQAVHDDGGRVRLWAAPRRRPAAWLRKLNREGVDLLLICGEWEGRAIRQGTSAASLRRLRRSGRFRFEYEPELEHGLLVASQRRSLVTMITEHVIEHFAPPPLPEQGVPEAQARPPTFPPVREPATAPGGRPGVSAHPPTGR